MAFTTYAKMRKAFIDRGCSELLIKQLSPHQDNEKNQVYLGGSSNELISILPGEDKLRSKSTSVAKKRSNTRFLIIEKSIKLFWLNESEPEAYAPHAKIINYFQYPEIRLSGFLRGCPNPPDALRRDNQHSYGRRFLVLGISGEEIYATVVTDMQREIIQKILPLPKWEPYKLFKVLTLTKASSPLIDPTKLLAEIRLLSGKKYEGCSLKERGQKPQPYFASNGAGYTLEALLDIPKNSNSGPDKYGFEIKAFTRNRITLMTPEPDFGYRYEQGLTAFLHQFGWPGTKKDGSHRFNGKHNTLRAYPLSNLKLEILHWDAVHGVPTGKGNPDVILVDNDTREIAAGWTFTKLSASWSKKHAGGMYVQATRAQPLRTAKPPRYSFGPEIHCGIGTSPLYLLKAISEGRIYLDPGDRVDSIGQEKKRTQWRIDKPRGVKLSEALSHLYDDMKTYQI